MIKSQNIFQCENLISLFQLEVYRIWFFVYPDMPDIYFYIRPDMPEMNFEEFILLHNWNFEIKMFL